MKNQKLSCTFWLLVFLALCGAAGFFVYRRVPEGPGAAIGGFIGGIILIITFSWLLAIPQRIWEWLLVLRAKIGREPSDGSKVALIGTLRGLGDLTTPFSHQHCIAYAYEISNRIVRSHSRGTTIEIKKSYEGFAMVPLAIEHGTDRTRILAKPEMSYDEHEPSGPGTLANAKQFVESTAWNDGPTTEKEPDLSHTDGRWRFDDRLIPDADLDEAKYTEKVVRGNVNACAIGEYRAEKRALVGTVRLTIGEAFGIRAAWRIVNAGIGFVIFGAIAVVAAAFFLAHNPLDAVESSHPDWKLTWPEIELERFVDTQIRPKMAEAGMFSESSGFYLQDVPYDTAKGELIVNDRVIELKHARYVGGKTIHLSATPNGTDGITLNDRVSLTVTIDGKELRIPTSWLRDNDVVTSLGSGETADYAGRIMIFAPDRWLRARVTFKTRVASDAWLPGRTPPAEP